MNSIMYMYIYMRAWHSIDLQKEEIRVNGCSMEANETLYTQVKSAQLK